jgi:DNA-binding NarL/FixJ family response regulator
MAARRRDCHHTNTLTRVLIVDDHPSFRATARALLEAEGYDVVGEAENGVAALKQAKELHPDVVLLDVQLPDFDGFEVATRLTSQNGAQPAVVLTSSRDGSDFGPLVCQSGARGFIAKGELSGAALKAVLG